MQNFRGKIGFIRYKANAEVGTFYIFSLETGKEEKRKAKDLLSHLEAGRNAKTISVKGECSFELRSGMKIVVRGEEGAPYKGEPQIMASYIAPDVEISNKGARGWLKTLPVTGFGERSCNKLINKYESSLSEVLGDVEALKRAGLKKDVAERLSNAWAILSMPADLLELFDIDGLSPKLVTRILETYGGRIHEVLDNDPWDLARTVRGVGFKSADEIARIHGVDMNSDQRFIALVHHIVVNEMTSRGHTLMTDNEVIREAKRLGFTDADRIRGIIGQMTEDGKTVVREPLSGMLGSRWVVATERSLCAHLLRLLEANKPDEQEVELYTKRVLEAERLLGIELDESQRAAAVGALSHRVAVITGGPGTGKSTTQSVILNALKQDKEEKVLLVAPTGRAARRLAEATNSGASTIHRALKFDPMEGGFFFNEFEKLPHTTVISDEYSMVDVDLAHSLTIAIETGSRLIIVGDDDQLPSVGQGQVLADLIKSGVIPVFRLSVIHRQAQQSGIITAAHAISREEVPEFNERDFFFEPANNPKDVQSVIIDLITKKMPDMGYKDQDDIMILTPQRKGPLGSEKLNEIIKDVLNPAQKSIRHTIDLKGVKWSVGDKVMHTKNNYDKMVFNGEMGTVTRAHIDKKENTRQIFVTYPDREEEIAYDSSDISELDFAWASTIHKVQGSEAASVAMIVSSMHQHMLEKCLVFTGETRAKKVCFIVGEKPALQRAVRNKRASLRKTGLCGYLRQSAGLPQLEVKVEEPAAPSRPVVRRRPRVRVNRRS